MTICKNCDHGQVVLGEVYFSEGEGYNTVGVGVFDHFVTGVCPCCYGNYFDCKKCKEKEEQDERSK